MIAPALSETPFALFRKSFLSSRLPVLLASLVLCAVCGVLYAWSIFVMPLEQTFGWQRAEASLTFTLMMVFFSLGMFSGGFLMERFGATRTLLTGGTALCGGLLAASWVSSLAGLYLSYGVVAGFGVGIINLVPAAICLRLYPEKKGLISGLLTMALAVGTLLFGTVGAGWLIEQTGVSHTFQTLSLLFAVIIALMTPFVRLPSTDSVHSSGAEKKQNEAGGISLGNMLRTPTYWLIWGWMAMIQIGGLMIIGHIVPYALEAGLTQTQAAAAMGVYAIANGIGRLFFGYVYDRFGKLWSLTLDAAFMGVGLVLLATLPPVAGLFGLLVATVPIAMSFGGTIPQLAALIMAFFGPRQFGVNYGFSTTPLMAASICGPFLGGLMQVHSGSYLTAIFVAAAVSCLALFPAVLVGRQTEPVWKTER